MKTINTHPRRYFLRQLGALAAGSLALPSLSSENTVEADACYRSFANNRHKTWTRGFAGIDNDLPLMSMQIKGNLPTQLQGSLFRNGSGRYSMAEVRYRHLFDGDGLIQRYRIRNGAVTHEARFVRTDKFVAENRAGRFLRMTYGTRPPGMEPLSLPDTINLANTSVLYHHGELLALWEPGSANRIDPDSIDSLGLKTWRADYAGMPFSAHPKVEPDGSLWNFGVSSLTGMLSIYRIAKDGRLLEAKTQKIPNMTMVHDFVVTENYLVFPMPPFIFNPSRLLSGKTPSESYEWKPELGLRVLVVEKADLDKQHWFELPARFVFHTGNAYERNGKIFFDFASSPDAWNTAVMMPKVMDGTFEFSEAKSHLPMLTLVELDLRARRAAMTVTDHTAEFPCVDPRTVGRQHRSLYSLARLGNADRPGYDALLHYDTASQKVQHFRYGDEYLVEEHVLMPRPGSTREDDGWLIGSALDVKRQVMTFSVFHPRRIGDGPLAQATMPRLAPFGLHAAFMPA